MRTGTTVPYATKRINQHIVQFNKLYDDVRSAQGQRALAHGRRVPRQYFPATWIIGYTRAEASPYRACPIPIPLPAPLKVLFVSSEVAPFAKTGGLADVVGALPKALRALDMDVRVVMPLYAGMPWNDLEVLDGFLTVPMWWGAARGRVRVGRLPDTDVPVYCLEYNRYFDRPYLYGPPG